MIADRIRAPATSNNPPTQLQHNVIPETVSPESNLNTLSKDPQQPHCQAQPIPTNSQSPQPLQPASTEVLHTQSHVQSVIDTEAHIEAATTAPSMQQQQSQQNHRVHINEGSVLQETSNVSENTALGMSTIRPTIPPQDNVNQSQNQNATGLYAANETGIVSIEVANYQNGEDEYVEEDIQTGQSVDKEDNGNNQEGFSRLIGAENIEPAGQTIITTDRSVPTYNAFQLLDDTDPIPESMLGILAEVDLVTQRMDEFLDPTRSVSTAKSSKNRNSVSAFNMGPRRSNRFR